MAAGKDEGQSRLTAAPTLAEGASSGINSGDVVIRAESTLIRWEDGLALFRVRLTRADGAVAEAHAAAHDGEAEQFWLIAEDRAHTRARSLLDSLPVASPVTSPASPVRPAPDTTAVPRTDPPVILDAAVSEAPPAPRSAVSPAGNSAPAEDPAGEEGPDGRSAHAAMVPPAAPDSLDGSDLLDGSDPLEASDPFEEDAPRSNGTSPSPSGPLQSSHVPSGPGASRSTPSIPRPGHIRGEPGGATPPAPSAPPSTPRVSPPRTTPAPLPARCTHPGCNLPLTPAQATLSNHKYGQLLCSQHQRDRDASPPKG